MPAHSIPTIEGIDHVHVYVSDRRLAEQWYADVLGYRRVSAYEAWAQDGGPLTLANAQGNVHLALFERDSEPASNVLAFGTAGPDFVRWVAYLDSQKTEVQIKDHGLAISMYFHDLDRNGLEITTYDHALVRKELRLSEDIQGTNESDHTSHRP